MKFSVAGEYPRRDQSRKHTTERAPNRDHQVERGEVPLAWFQFDQLAVTDHARREQQDAVNQHLRKNVRGRAAEDYATQKYRDGQCGMKYSALIPSLGIETNDE